MEEWSAVSTSNPQSVPCGSNSHTVPSTKTIPPKLEQTGMTNLRLPASFGPVDNKACWLDCWWMEPGCCCMAADVTVLRPGAWTPSPRPAWGETDELWELNCTRNQMLCKEYWWFFALFYFDRKYGTRNKEECTLLLKRCYKKTIRNRWNH